MLDPQTSTLLDNPGWSALNSNHAHFALGDKLARRYPREMSPIAGVSAAHPSNVSALEKLVGAGDSVAIARLIPPFSSNWAISFESMAVQMICQQPIDVPVSDSDVSALSITDIPEMIALVELTHPGPFLQRTIEMGTYLGIRQNGQLVAMAGERMFFQNCREISAVCTHPEFLARGYASHIVSVLTNEILKRNQIPFLQVVVENERAKKVYEKLGFKVRTEFPLAFIQRVE
jgi:predicted GNAT family acetyltransferase